MVESLTLENVLSLSQFLSVGTNVTLQIIDPSLLPIILERVIVDKLCNYVSISDRQWAFLAGRSSTGAILSAVHDWQSPLRVALRFSPCFSTYRRPLILCLTLSLYLSCYTLNFLFTWLPGFPVISFCDNNK